jgi:hypothetical protein
VYEKARIAPKKKSEAPSTNIRSEMILGTDLSEKYPMGNRPPKKDAITVLAANKTANRKSNLLIKAL